jgi:hypothetical protein
MISHGLEYSPNAFASLLGNTVQSVSALPHLCLELSGKHDKCKELDIANAPRDRMQLQGRNCSV